MKNSLNIEFAISEATHKNLQEITNSGRRSRLKFEKLKQKRERIIKILLIGFVGMWAIVFPLLGFLVISLFRQTVFNKETFSLPTNVWWIISFLLSVFFIVLLIGIVRYVRYHKKVKPELIDAFKKLNLYSHQFKNLTIPEILNSFYTSLKYDADSYIPYALFRRSGLPKYPANYYKGEDHIVGKVGNTEIQFSELNLAVVFDQDTQKREFTDEDAWKQFASGRNYNREIRGVFFIADFNKNFNTSLAVFTKKYNTSGKPLGWPVGLKEGVQLEWPEFMNIFNVKANNQVEARYILSTSLMKRLIEYQKKNQSDIFLTFSDSTMYLFAPAPKSRINSFDPCFLPGVEITEMLKNMYDDLFTFISIVEELNLNTRVWTK